MKGNSCEAQISGVSWKRGERIGLANLPAAVSVISFMSERDQDEEVLNIFRRESGGEGETGALLEGHFILRSGLRSGHFFQCARVGEHLDKICRLAEMLIKRLPPDLGVFPTVIAPAMGGLVIGQEVAGKQVAASFCGKGR